MVSLAAGSTMSCFLPELQGSARSWFAFGYAEFHVGCAMSGRDGSMRVIVVVCTVAEFLLYGDHISSSSFTSDPFDVELLLLTVLGPS